MVLFFPCSLEYLISRYVRLFVFAGLFDTVHLSNHDLQKSYNFKKRTECKLITGSSHIQSVIIGVEYLNCCQTLDVYLLFAILLGQTKSKLNYRLVTYKLASP